MEDAFTRNWAGDGVTTLFVHGAGSDHSVWLPVIERLEGDIWAVDLPGHGRTPGPALATIEEVAAWTMEVLEGLGHGRVSLVGHSMGSLVALECAAARPEIVERIGLVATSDRMAVNPLLQRAADDRTPSTIEMILRWSFTGDADPTARDRALIAARSKLEASLKGALAADLRACNEYEPLARAARVRCPVLVVAGSKDLMTPGAAGRRLADALPGSEFVLLEGAGHNTLAEDPEPIARLLARFLVP